ncbi:MAG TPA: lactate racemase domain-containing protein [Polyangiaceae bacterium]|jgi:nickel-dependent lactate racemase/gluconate kinase|nr:lactate racemase domain-containing protein [Polyangiaceae bacterium]
MLIALMHDAPRDAALGARLGRRLGLPTLSSDTLHAPEARAKLLAGRALDDADRQHFLNAFANRSAAFEAQGGVVLDCSSREAALLESLVSRVTPSRLLQVPAQGGAVLKDALSIPNADTPEEIVEHSFRKLAREGYAGRGKIHFAEGGRQHVIDERRAGELVDGLLNSLGPLKRVLLLPPDFTRFHSGAGELACQLYTRLVARGAEVELLPALGTHAPMTTEELHEMFPGIPLDRFRIHEWRTGLHVLGEVPGSFVREVSGGKLDYPIRCEIDQLLVTGGWDRIISIGQLVPHEVIGIASHDKNIFVGTGGKDVIDRTHFLGAVCDMESVMGRPHSPVRDVLLYMAGELATALPITHLLTVRERGSSGEMLTRGLFAGDDYACFAAGAPLVQACNLELFDAPLHKVVVYLDPSEFKSTWLGNKSVYRTRMALADAGELLVLAPGVARFGEDPGIDRLIRKYGYHGTPRTLQAVRAHEELGASLSAAAHLIHGSSEGRFRIRYAAGGLSREEVESAGYEYAEIEPALSRYDPRRLSPGMNRLPDGEEVFFVPNPALGLWGLRSKFGR